ncbi:protealysin inhibitor emfourin [Microbacterium trichothecenolyticum]|uniref:FOG: TPR repeat, SEL1 subfamily n=1 Tax=Microbacterium trichothecenolyticum TaxID=69370 RepID=A0ABU0TTA2_MICTR|nr:protealysin inhibitor emfourin [Microbacterium trichothecenolyticum]MDQ1122890.1 hypothetical protein [Microbacterium trichothecenolyticum]
MPEPDDEHLVIVVVRSGGIAGLSKQWRAEPDPARAPYWRELVEKCPWDATPAATSGADHYQWRIEVQRGDTAVRRARLGDGQIEGPWRALVDEVRNAASR